MSDLELTGLDGSNPLGFLAALGTLNVLADSMVAPDPPRLSWRDSGVWRPVIHTSALADRTALVARTMQDLATWRDEPALSLKYGKKGTVAHDLKPPPDQFREYLVPLIQAAHQTRARRAVDFVAAFATDVAVDNNDNTKPTALHFTAGNQQFLDMVQQLAESVTAEDLDEALFGPWRYARPLPVLQWDNTTSRDYAFRASDPAKEKKLGVPGADWLAFRGLSFIRVVPNDARIVTTCCSGDWKTATFRWPLWIVPLTREVAMSALTLSLRHGDAAREAAAAGRERRERGIAAVFEAAIRRTDQGGYGSFTPARPV